MTESPQHSWVRVMVLVGAAYVVIGVVFAALDDSPDPNRVQMWRLAAWAASGATGAAHILYEQFQRGSAPLTTAMHAAGAIAIGAFGHGLAANVHWLFAAPPGQRMPLLALPLWPLITALPGFLLAFAAAFVLSRLSRRT